MDINRAIPQGWMYEDTKEFTPVQKLRRDLVQPQHLQQCHLHSVLNLALYILLSSKFPRERFRRRILCMRSLVDPPHVLRILGIC
jgi:hypothetical protein